LAGTNSSVTSGLFDNDLLDLSDLSLDGNERPVPALWRKKFDSVSGHFAPP
jgi:hypothetical protein